MLKKCILTLKVILMYYFKFILCFAYFSSKFARMFLSYREYFALSIELVERFFCTLRFPSRDRFHLTLVRPRLHFVVIYLARIAGTRIIAYYWSFIDQHTIEIHSLYCLALWCRLLYRRSFSISSDFALFRCVARYAMRLIYSVITYINKYARIIAEIIICSYIKYFFSFLLFLIA